MDRVPCPDFSMLDKQTQQPLLVDTLEPNDDASVQTGSAQALRSQLCSADRESLDVFLSLMSTFDESTKRIMDFCEHCFSDKVTMLVASHIERHLSGFNELLTQIASQEKFTQEAREARRPSPVMFSIASWRNFSYEGWPEAESNAWIDAAEAQLRAVPPVFPPSPKKAPLEQRLAKAAETRKRLENVKSREIREKTNKVRRANERRGRQKEEAISALMEKHDGATQRREALINQVKEKAHSEVEKAQEMKFMQDLEVEGRKLALERNMSLAKQRHEQMVRGKSEKAKERTAKGIDSPSPKRTHAHVPESDVVGAILQKRWPFKDDGYFNDREVPVPDLNMKEDDTPPQITQLMSIRSRMERERGNAQLASKYVKFALAQHAVIPGGSFEAREIASTIEVMIDSLSLDLVQLLRQVVQILPTSFDFALRVAVQCTRGFGEFVEKGANVAAVEEMISIFSEIFKGSNVESNRILLGYMLETRCLERICFVVEALTAGAIKHDHVRRACESVLGLIGAISNFLKRDRDKFDIVISLILCPALLSFISIMGMRPLLAPVPMVVRAVKTLSVLGVVRSESVLEAIDGQNAASLVQAVKVFVGHEDTRLLPIADELIVLFGILCGRSPVMRESCCWAPPPTVIEKLCGLPLAYFIQEKTRGILLPTLISCCISSDVNTEIVKNSVNGAMLVSFLETMRPVNGDIMSPHFRIPSDRKEALIAVFKT